MKTRPAYLVIDTLAAKGPMLRRVTQSWPSLEGGEITVRLSLEIPDELLPQVQEFTLDELDAMVYVTPEEVELPA